MRLMCSSLRVALKAIALLSALSACAGLPPQTVTQPSRPMAYSGGPTKLGAALAQELAKHSEMSGYHTLASGPDAFIARMALVRAAQQSIDVQYYAFHADKLGAALLNELLAAADRGVRVRLLLDDLHTSGMDVTLAAINSHPNLEVRLFNPFMHRHARWIDFMTDFERVNRRMHNKSLTADNQASVVGGRNIGDEYFSASNDLRFSDFDVIAIGPVVAEVSAEFEEYWDSKVTYPLALLKMGGTSQADLAEGRRKLTELMATLRASDYAAALGTADLAESIRHQDVPFYWGSGKVLADQPAKVTLSATDDSTHAMPEVRRILEQATQELLLVSPYLVPGKAGVQWLQGIEARGIQVKILTNSFAATDVTIVHAAYSSYRKTLLRSGIELYELKPSFSDPAAKGLKQPAHVKKASLHAKTYIADSRTALVGSMNLDPRSAQLNTEMGIVIGSESLSADVRERLLARLPEIAYRVELDRTADPAGRLVWITHEDGREMRYGSEPNLGFFDRIMGTLARVFPIEKQL